MKLSRRSFLAGLSAAAALVAAPVRALAVAEPPLVEPKAGWLLCNGAPLDRTRYADLFKVIGDTFGSAGANTFCLPDLRARVSVDKPIQSTLRQDYWINTNGMVGPVGTMFSVMRAA